MRDRSRTKLSPVPLLEKDPLAVELGRRGGVKGGRARAARLSPAERSAAARAAAAARWRGAQGATAKPAPEREPRVAQAVADRLRRRIVGGALKEGDRLPTEALLRVEFGVSRTSLREALRILEAEGLLAVQRGKRGGAVVHAPHAPGVAYALGLVLASQRVALSDLAAALRELEPLCAALCAERVDRATAMLPGLRELHAQLGSALDDSYVFTDLSRRFHERIVASCGNETLVHVVGALETLWSSHVRTQVGGETRRGFDRGPASRAESQADHQRIIGLIERGEAERVRRAVRGHLDRVQPRRTRGRRLVLGTAGPRDQMTAPVTRRRYDS